MRYSHILITGGAGAIGSNLTRKLLENKTIKKVVVIDDLSSGSFHNIPKDKRVQFIRGSISNKNTLKKAFSGKVDVVFHLAAHFANQNSIEHPREDLLTNTFGTLELLEYSRVGRVKRFIYFSTSCIYRSKKNGKLSESDLDLKFETPYAISKYTGERYVNFYNEFHKLPTVILRIFNSFGPGERPGRYRNVIPNFLYRAIKGESLIITGSGKETRNFTYVADIINGAILASQNDSAIGLTINLGSEREIPIITLAHAVNKITNNRKPIIFKPKRSWDHTLSRKGDLGLAKKVLGFTARTKFEDGLRKTHEWMISEKEKKNIV